MKTPMQEMLEWLDNVITLMPSESIGAKNQLIITKAKAESLLEKEKEVIMDAYIFGIQDEYVIGSQRYYNETFNIKEK